MEQKRITHIKMSDGTLAPVRYLTDEKDWPEDVRRLANSAREASRAAIKRLLDAGIPAYYMQDKNLVCLHPDGHVEVIKENIIP